MRVLFIGGTGVISSACSKLAIERGIELYLLNRDKSFRPIPDGAHLLKADIRDKEAVRRVIDKMAFDSVVEWIAFTPDQIEADLEIFKDRTQQYLFISSASVYQTPPAKLPVTEETPLENPYWEYSRNKIACEKRLRRAYQEERFPITIVRPSHTYDCTLLPMHGGYTIVNRMRKEKKIIVHGDGSSLWVLTHHRDFAKGLVGLLGNSNAIGEDFHITSDELLTWNQIFGILAEAAGAEAKIVHVPSEIIARFDPQWGDSLLGDKMHSMIFDNSKIKRFVPDFKAEIPFEQGAAEIMQWYDADPNRQVIDNTVDLLIDEIIRRFELVR
ncbi:MAG: NAD-dependent epimerase/dehydratase family protein [Candidatus Marinimicrobia bacterium]|jgi:nucleoside-diphosphate-sugar epimerase|nr:NAD-dependent epimerase/dehydratase family protein [Candidatus Neomarinimicrobiota bacterium]MCK9484011.1 NAD-dependent epimerase/dehydratase family protein [Candidatus Neomarinimicrobiota bacterium]MCK9559433.1 NAD-dependent epimerase/dehydratase family protein [Candidatus Neomarinimicrobiota bacterium]MDD5061641.1 NAD-dependent epimerase/dehydratase family protein [Candidatus Neomarinimicrobiota bacterium]MDD5230446.1 NAD-dependent epimerase/dehydratase family protein [Candidatus Neomarini